MSEDHKVRTLPVTFKTPPGSGVYLVPSSGQCMHGQYVVDQKLAEVSCALCKEKLNPMHVLSELAYKETNWHRTRAAYLDERKRLDARERTKCDHCGKMTRISQR